MGSHSLSIGESREALRHLIPHHDPVDALHQVERRAQDGAVFAQSERPRHRDRGPCLNQRAHHPELSRHVEGGRREVSARRSAQHRVPSIAAHQEGQARLTVAEPLELEGTGELRQAPGEEAPERLRINGGQRLFVDRHGR